MHSVKDHKNVALTMYSIGPLAQGGIFQKSLRDSKTREFTDRVDPALRTRLASREDLLKKLWEETLYVAPKHKGNHRAECT
jgi:hypothetical protein